MKKNDEEKWRREDWSCSLGCSNDDECSNGDEYSKKVLVVGCDPFYRHSWEGPILYSKIQTNCDKITF